MTTKTREVEAIVLAMFAAVPLYFTYAMGLAPLVVFHLALAGVLLRVALNKGPELIPLRAMRVLTLAYLPFYLVDWRLLSGSALAASAHLVFFIAVYQAMESGQRDNHIQRMLTTTLIFIASLATSTHIAVLPFVLAFSYLVMRQLMHVSHVETMRAIARPYTQPPTTRAAAFYLTGAMGIGAVLFPLLPRVRSPFLEGMTGPLSGSSAVLSETIDFTQRRTISNDSTVIARVWMSPSERAFFAPIRLRGRIYDRYARGRFRQTYRGAREVLSNGGIYTLSRENGTVGEITIQQRVARQRMFLPVGTTSFSGPASRVYEGPTPETYYTYQDGLVNITARVATQAEPLTLKRVTPTDYPVPPEVEALARRIVGDETDPERQATLIENYLSSNFRYVADPASIGRTMSVDQFLLRDRVGHCEYFAAGMVALMTSLDVPSRIAGGYYGGRYNPLGGYYAIRREDAHAWTEVWNGERWVTYDSTPATLRPGAATQSTVREYLVGLADSMTFIWDRYVLTFSLGDQVSLAEDLITSAKSAMARFRGNVAADAKRVASRGFASLAAALVVVGFGLIVVTRRRRPIFDVLAKHLAARGIAIGPAMTMEDALRKLRAQHPAAARELEPVIALYEEEVFSSRRDRSRVARIRRVLAEMKV